MLKGIEKVNIMIVDDILSNRKILEYTLKKLGVKEITTCSSGAEAIAAAQEKEYGLILMDLHMPEMSGFSTAKKILENSNGNKPRIVAQTADETDETRARIEKIGFVDCLTKPIRPHEIAECIQKLGI